VFVRGALPGELVRARVLAVHRRHLEAELVEVIEPADARVDPPCPHADACGGCGWQHVLPGAQGPLKRKIVADQLRRVLADQGVRERPVVQAGPPLGYRRRARLHYRVLRDGPTPRLELGFHRVASREIVDIPSCPVLTREVDVAVQRLRRLAPLLPDEGEVLAVGDGERAVLGLPGVKAEPALEAACRELLDDTLTGISLRGGRKRVGVGEVWLQLDADDEAGIVAAPGGAFLFAQANAHVNRELVRWVRRMARPQGRRVLELYAGAGNLSRAIAPLAERVWTLEDARDAVSIMLDWLGANDLPINAKHGKAEALLASLAKARKGYDVVVLDPPRKGLGVQASRDLARVAQQAIVYVSCDPASLARDLEVLTAAGFSLRDVTPFDMMPMTPEVEVVATLTRGGGGA
jgi:23S rRNA (uracil1939-C5)-methyltransferase